MASDEITYLRLLLAEPLEPTGNVPLPGQAIAGSLFGDDQLQILIDMTSMISRAAEVGWKSKAAYFQTLIDVEESGSVRKLSQMFKQAMQMAAQFKITADEEMATISSSVRVVGVGASPWGPQWSIAGVSPSGSYILGDVSRAGYGGSIFFIEVPVDPNLLNEKFFDTSTPEPITAGVTAITEVQVPTVRRTTMHVEQGRSFSFLLDYLDPASGSQVDISGWNATFTVRTEPGGTQLYSTALTTQPDVGKFLLEIASVETVQFAFPQGDYEVIASDNDSNSFSLLSGIMQVSVGDV